MSQLDLSRGCYHLTDAKSQCSQPMYLQNLKNTSYGTYTKEGNSLEVLVPAFP